MLETHSSKAVPSKLYVAVLTSDAPNCNRMAIEDHRVCGTETNVSVGESEFMSRGRGGAESNGFEVISTKSIYDEATMVDDCN